MNFCRTFRNTALKEIGKIYAVQGRKFLLSFPAPYTCDQFKARGLSSWLAQSASSTQHMWELLAGNRMAALLRHARRRRIRSYPDLCASKFNKTNLKQGEHIQKPTASSTSHMLTTCVFFLRDALAWLLATPPKGELTHWLHPFKLRAQPQFFQVKRERW